MKNLTSEIKRAKESEIVLRDDSQLEFGCLSKFFGSGIVLGIFALLYEYDDSILLYCLNCFNVVILVMFWQLFGFEKVIQFNQPVGYLKIKEAPWWSVFIPFGPKIIKGATLGPLPKSPFQGQVRINPPSTNTVYWTEYTLNNKDSSIIPIASHQTQYTVGPYSTYRIQLPLYDSKELTLWTTTDHNTYIEIVRRINKAIQDCQQLEKTRPRQTVSRQ